MKRFLFLMIAGLSFFCLGCSYTAVPVEYANPCDKANNGKYIEVVGFFKNTGSAMCSKSGNEPMRCPVDFVDTPDQPKPVRANIDLGSGANYIENIEDKGLTIKDDKGEVIPNSQKVRVTASLMIYSGAPDPKANYAPCSITVKKIEKTP